MTTCGACGEAFASDEHGLEERTCDCVTCARCRKEYRVDDGDGPTVAPSDEDAAKFDKFDEGRCAACWKEIYAAAAKKEKASARRGTRRAR